MLSHGLTAAEDSRCLFSSCACAYVIMSTIKPVPIVDIQGWKLAGNNARKKKKKKDLNCSGSSEEEIKLQNSFEVLSEETKEETMDQTEPRVGQNSNKVKVPPLVIYTNIENHSQAMKDLRQDLLEDFTLSCKRNRIVIYTKNMSDYQKVSDKIAAAQIPYHTYTPDSEKPVTSILKGLASNITEDEVKNDLKENHLKVIEVKQFIKKVLKDDNTVISIKLPVFSVKFDKETKINEFKSVRKVCWCKVSWHKSFSSNSVTQCYKCQSFGHIAKNCFRKEVCVICSGGHNTRECKNTKEVKCANCGKSHQANDASYEYYERVARRRNLNNNNRDNRPNLSRAWAGTPHREKTATNSPKEGEKPSYSEASQGKGKFSGNNNHDNNRNKKNNNVNGDILFSMFNDIKNIFNDLILF